MLLVSQRVTFINPHNTYMSLSVPLQVVSIDFKYSILLSLMLCSQESEKLKREKEAANVELEKLQLTVKEGEMIKEQLTVQVAQLKGDKEAANEFKEELSTTKIE